MKKHHKFHKTTIEHHQDGSHTIEHHHEDGDHKNVRSGAGDHDAMIDHLMEHTSAPNPGEAEAEKAEHGVEPQAAAAAGLPGPVAGA